MPPDARLPRHSRSAPRRHVTYGERREPSPRATASAICALLALAVGRPGAPRPPRRAARPPPRRRPRAVGTTRPTSRRSTTQPLAWAPCDQDLECSWLTVPLDYSAPAGRDDPDPRVPGRPPPARPPSARAPSSSIPAAPAPRASTSPPTWPRGSPPRSPPQFDVVGFDTRGVGKSAPVTCLTGRQTTRWLRADGSPDTAAEERRLMSLAARLAQGCLEMSPRHRPARRLGRHRPRHGHPARGPGRRAAQLARLLVRHLPRHPVRRALPRPGRPVRPRRRPGSEPRHHAGLRGAVDRASRSP